MYLGTHGIYRSCAAGAAKAWMMFQAKASRALADKSGVGLLERSETKPGSSRIWGPSDRQTRRVLRAASCPASSATVVHGYE